MRGCRFLLAFFLALGAVPAGAAVPSLLLDINQVSGTGLTLGVAGPLVPVGDRVVFPAFQEGSGVELWASDGTPAGTLQLLDSLPGPESAQFHLLGTLPQAAIYLVEHGFRERFQIWRSNGTAAGTLSLTDSAAGGPFMCFDRPLTAVAGNVLFFTAAATDTGCELWRTDGTAAGTRLVLDNNPGTFDGAPDQLVAAGGRAFFFWRGTLWISDGTEAGTRELRQFRFYENSPRELTAAGSRVYFLAVEQGSTEEELWTSDGTEAGTRPVTNFFEPLPFRPEPYDSLLGLIGGTFYFLADDGTGLDLWRTDGTVSSTRRVTDFVSTQPFPERFDATQLARLGNLLVFQAREDSGPLHLWVSGGTPETTRQITDCPGGCPDVFTELIPVGNRIVLTGTDPEHGEEIWVTDGTGAGTQRLTDRCPGPCGSIYSDLFLRLGKVFFIGPGSSNGFAIYWTTPTVTVRLADLGTRPFNFPNEFSPVTAGSKIFFAADPGDQGAQLWVSDATSAGTRQVSNLGSDSGSSPVWFTPFAGGVLFNAYDGSERHLWRSQGTAASTVEIQASGDPVSPPVVSDGLAWFLRNSAPSVGPTEVWRTDGSEIGTVRVSPVGNEPLGTLVPFREGAVFLTEAEDDSFRYVFWKTDSDSTQRLFELPTYPRFLRSLGQNLYFVALQGDTSADDQLWVSDGTEAGTRALTDFHDYAFDSQDPPEMALVGNTVFFTAHRRLWKTDGTKAGTVPVLPAALEGSQPTSFVKFRGLLYFIGATAQGPVGRGLWRSDGTAAGTFLVKAVGPPYGNIRPEPAWPTVVGDRLFFAASDGTHGTELWSTDGTTAGTVLVRDIAPGVPSSKPAHLVGAKDRLYFAATDGTTGIELWESDGTAGGTFLHEILPGAGSSNPTGLTVSGNRVYFSAVDGIHGEEPWVLPLETGVCTPTAEALCLGGRFRVEADWQAQGNQGKGRVVALTADTGYFWFFDPANVEVVLKVLDGRGINGHYWVFYGALSNVAYTLTVTDTRTGAVKRYENPAGRLASVADTRAFPQGAAAAAENVIQEPAPQSPPAALDFAAEAGTCAPSSTRLCLNNGRFSVQARWRAQGRNGLGQAIPLDGGDTGYFWFFDAANVEVVLKVLDGRPLNDKFWVFYGALSNVEYTLIVTDTVTGQVKRYRNPNGRLASVADTGAF